jgi:hypothetical protein
MQNRLPICTTKNNKLELVGFVEDLSDIAVAVPEASGDIWRSKLVTAIHHINDYHPNEGAHYAN